MTVFLNIIKSIWKKGFGWFFKRLKAEFVSPRMHITKTIVLKFHDMRSLLQKSKQTSCQFVTGKTMLAFYDLNNESITFDFTVFLASAETYAILNGRKKIYVVFIPLASTDLLDPLYLESVPESGLSWRFTNILIPLVSLYRACSGFIVLDNNEAISGLAGDKLVYPPKFSSFYRPPMQHEEAFPLLNRGIFSGFSAPEEGLRFIDKWRKAVGRAAKMIVVTLRQYGYDPSRNSNVSEWLLFADWVRARGFMVVFVPDTECALDKKLDFGEHVVFSEPCFNLGLRLSLYEKAYLNFFYSNGLGFFAMLDKSVRLVMMDPYIEESLMHYDQTVIYGLAPGETKHEFAEDHQLLSWNRDNFESICADFLRFEDVMAKACTIKWPEAVKSS